MLARSILLLLFFYGCTSGQAFAHTQEFDEIKQLLQDNHPDEAYRHLMAAEVNHMGEPEYDLLLARAALKTKHHHEAIFAYERILIVQPNNHIARLELAVAYYQIDELESALRLFNELLQANPPAKLASEINQYLVHINDRIESRKHTLSAELGLKQGWDSNINSATNESAIVLTVGIYRPTEGVDKETAGSFSETNARLNYQYNANINSRLFSNAGFTRRGNHGKTFDTESADVRLGFSQQTGLGRISVPVSYQTMWLDNNKLRNVTTVGTDLNRSDNNSFSNYGLQYGEIRYPSQPALNVNFTSLSLAFGFSGRISQQYALFYGDETPLNSLYEFNARKYYGLQIRLPIRLGQAHTLVPRVIYQVGDYKARHPFFSKKRNDDYHLYEIGWNWYFSKDWNLQTLLSHTDSQSTVPIYTHTRNVVSAGVTYRF